MQFINSAKIIDINIIDFGEVAINLAIIEGINIILVVNKDPTIFIEISIANDKSKRNVISNKLTLINLDIAISLLITVIINFL
nr:hypothetical protein [Rickettsia endosymbiont of Cardiosporidium cionae]